MAYTDAQREMAKRIAERASATIADELRRGLYIAIEFRVLSALDCAPPHYLAGLIPRDADRLAEKIADSLPEKTTDMLTDQIEDAAERIIDRASGNR